MPNCASIIPSKPLSTINLLDFNRRKLEAFFREIGEPCYRAQQILQWIHQYGVTDFSAMTNLSKACREKLSQQLLIETLSSVSVQQSKDGTRKWLLRLKDNNCIETVFIPEEGRGTLCVSSQVGCALNCKFCSTGAMGFNRNLTVGEIIGQVWFAVRELTKKGSLHDRAITNIVMMGMGEPLLNYENVKTAMDIMMDDYAYGLSKYRVTLSTSGIVPTMYELSKSSDCSLMVSLHASNDELRTQLIPINKKYPLKELMAACKTFFDKPSQRQVSFEYTMLDKVNDQPEHASQLIQLLNSMPAKVNLIPFNPFPNTVYRCSPADVITDFQDRLLKAGIRTTIRKTRGADINAACGQLVGDFLDKTIRSKNHRALIIQG